MKPYSILIHGTGSCGEGTPECADIGLQKLIEQLTGAGHKLTSASIVVDGIALPIIGALLPHPAADAPADPNAVTLVSISGQLAQVIELLTADMQPGEYELTGGEGQTTEPGVTLELIGGKVDLLLNGQGDLAGMLTEMRTLCGKKEEGSGGDATAPRSRGRGGKAAAVLPTQAPVVIEEAVPVAILGSWGRIAVPAVPVVVPEGVPVVTSQAGDVPPPSAPPPTVVEDTSGDGTEDTAPTVAPAVAAGDTPPTTTEN